MKKIYFEPEMQVVELNVTHQLLAGSITVDGDNLNVTLPGEEGDFGSGDIINAPGFNLILQ